MKKYLLILMFIFCLITLFTDNSFSNDYYKGCADLNSGKHELTDQEQKLFKSINNYREKYNLKPIPLSKSLTYVAQTHVYFSHKYFGSDSELILKDYSILHSWMTKETDNKDSLFCDYNKDNYCVWNKPRQLTEYRGDGVEIANWSGKKEISPEEALDIFQNSPPHDDMIINISRDDRNIIENKNHIFEKENIWINYNWKSIGIGIKGKFSVIWFGTRADPCK